MDQRTKTQLMQCLMDMGAVKAVTVTYNDGSTTSGFVQQISAGSGPRGVSITLCRFSASRGENPHILLDFEEIAAAAVTMIDGSTRQF